MPPFAQLYGEGSDSSIISFQVNDWVTLTPYASGVMVYYTVNGNYYRSKSVVPAEDPTSPGSPIAPTNTTYWEQQDLPEYVIQTADSLQQTGVSIGTNGALPPQNIEMINMAVKTANQGNGTTVLHNVCWLTVPAR